MDAAVAMDNSLFRGRLIKVGQLWPLPLQTPLMLIPLGDTKAD